VKGGLGHIIEYYGPGLKELSAMDRHVIANMGTELGATSTVFPSDEAVRQFLREHGRQEDWVELLADEGAGYDRHDEIDLSSLEPLIAKPSSPDAVVPVRELAGLPIYQAYIGSSANPGYRDFAIVAQIVKGRHVPNGVSLDINPTSRQLLEELIEEGEMLARVCTRLAAMGALGWGKRRPVGRSAYGRCRAISRVAPARSTTSCICAAPKQRPLPR
jgi:aconitate hydratase